MGIGRRLEREGLGRPSRLARYLGLGHGTLFDAEQGAAGLPIQQKEMSHLGHLSHGVHGSAFVIDRDQDRGTGQIVVPQVMMHDLIVPDAFAGLGIETEDAVSKEILADPIAAPVIIGGRSGAEEDPPPPGVQRDATPGIGASHALPCIGRPGVVAELLRMGNGMKDPASFAGPQVEGTDVAR